MSIRKANLASKAIIDKNEKEELLGGKSSIVRQRYAKKKHVLLLCKVSTAIFLHYNMLNILQDVKCKLEVIFIVRKLLFRNYACAWIKMLLQSLSNISLQVRVGKQFLT